MEVLFGNLWECKKNRDKLLKTIRDNYSRQLLTIRGYILFGLEECAERIGNPQQNDVF